MEKEPELFNKQFFLFKMRDTTTLYRLYNYFKGVEESLTLDELAKIEKLTKEGSSSFLSKIRRDMKKIKAARVRG